MRLSIIQPCFVPWLGYFEQIAVSDMFVCLDDVQYTKKDWRNTNQLKTQYGVKKISVPVQKVSRTTLINEVNISYRDSWEMTLLNQLTEWYKKARYFEEIMSLIAPELNRKHERLMDLDVALIEIISTYLGIDRPIRFASEVPRVTDDRNERIIEICKFFGGDLLYDGKSAANFIDVPLFRQNGIEVLFQDYIHTPYAQLWGEFVPYMSILDLLMNQGPGSRDILMSSPLPVCLLSA